MIPRFYPRPTGSLFVLFRFYLVGSSPLSRARQGSCTLSYLDGRPERFAPRRRNSGLATSATKVKSAVISSSRDQSSSVELRFLLEMNRASVATTTSVKLLIRRITSVFAEHLRWLSPRGLPQPYSRTPGLRSLQLNQQLFPLLLEHRRSHL